MTKNESSRRKEANEKAQEIHIDTETHTFAHVEFCKTQYQKL